MRPVRSKAKSNRKMPRMQSNAGGIEKERMTILIDGEIEFD